MRAARSKAACYPQSPSRATDPPIQISQGFGSKPRSSHLTGLPELHPAPQANFVAADANGNFLVL